MRGRIVIALLMSVAGSVSAAPKKLERMPKDLETRFSLSALPPHLRDRASVYLLDPAKGYVLERKGSNGFSCFVERTEWRFEDDADDIYTAVCYDGEGAAHHMKAWFDVAEMRARGVPPGGIAKEMTARYSSGKYPPPARPGLSYMVAPLMRTHPDPTFRDKAIMTMPMPHVMYYAPEVTNEAIGASPVPSPYPFIFEQGPHGSVIQLLGETERAKILTEERQLLADLCKYRAVLCLSDKPPAHAH